MNEKNFIVGRTERTGTNLDVWFITCKSYDYLKNSFIRCFWPRVNADRELELYLVSYIVDENPKDTHVDPVEDQCRGIKILLTDRDKFNGRNYNDVILDGNCPDMMLSEDENVLTTVERTFSNTYNNPSYKNYYYIIQNGTTLNEIIDYFLDHFSYKIDDDYDTLITRFKDDNQEIFTMEKLHEKVRLNR